MKIENSVKEFVTNTDFVECRKMLSETVGKHQAKGNKVLFEKAYAASIIMTFKHMEMYKNSAESKINFMEWRKKFDFKNN